MRRVMSAALDRFTDWFIPEPLHRRRSVRDGARLFVLTHFSGAPLALLVLVPLRAAAPAGAGGPWLALVASVASFFAYPFVLRATGWFDLLTFLSLEQVGVLTLYGAYAYGGPASPFLPWLIAIPVILLYHLGGRRRWRIVVFIGLALHLCAFYALYRQRDGAPPDPLIGVDLLSLFCAAVFIATTSLYHSSIIGAQQAELEREVRARRLTEVQLREAKEEAERANRAKSEFLAKMSHELRTPLNAIIGFSQVIGSELLGPVGLARYVEYGGDIERSGHHLLQIIADILDLAKIETGKFMLHESDFDLVKVIQEAVDLVRPLAEQRGVPILFDAPRPMPFHGDELRVKQILLNLLSNATKFTERGGIIKLAMKREPGAGVSLTVSDTGIGIPAADLARVLQPFEQVGNAMTSNGGGTGLGLPLARELAVLHGGTLSLASEPGRGTVVTVTFPESRMVKRRASPAELRVAR
jgi:signal transduction histidine kinase